MYTCFKDKTCLAKIATDVKKVRRDIKQSFERQKKIEADVQKGNKREKWTEVEAKEAVWQRDPSSHYRVNRSGPFALPRGKGRGEGQWKSEKERRIDECEPSKWYCQKIRRAIWLWLMLHSRVMHRHFWQLLSLLSLSGLPYRAKPGCGKPTTFPRDAPVKHAWFLITFSMCYSTLLEWWYELKLYTHNTPFLSIPVV